jgi:hypothetical protein
VAWIEGGEPDSFYRVHLARHGSTLTRTGSFVGDQLVLASVVPLLAGRPKLAATLFGTGLGVMVLSHAVEGNLGDELRSVARAPLRSLRAEGRFLLGMWRAGPTRYQAA